MSHVDTQARAIGNPHDRPAFSGAVTIADRPSKDSPTTSGSDLIVDEWLRRDAAEAGYELLEELGRGGMGVVFKAAQRELDRCVAIKMLREGDYPSPSERERFRKEARAVARLRHPNIVQIYDVGEFRGRPYLCLEYVAGGSLSRKLAGVPVPARTAAQVVETLARVMHFSHEHGVVHRDLKPANVLLEPSDAPNAVRFRTGQLELAHAEPAFELKVTDFGLAKRIDEPTTQTHTGDFLGTPSYMAPEQIAGNAKQIDRTVDVYALGAILYELLTGRAPFKAPTPIETYQQILTDEPVPPSRVLPRLSRDLETICLKCLEKSPRRRYRTAADLADDLRRYLDGLPIVARPTPPWERAAKWARRRPAVATLVAVVTLATLTVLGVVVRANARLGRERDFALQQEHIAFEQRERAEAALLRAIRSIDRTFTRISQGELRSVPGFEPLRKELLESAVHELNSLREEFGDRPAILTELGRAYFRAGDINQAAGRRADAFNAYVRAREILEQLARENPHEPSTTRDLAICYTNLSDLLLRLGKLDDSLHYAQETQRLYESLRSADAADVPTTRGLVLAHCNQGEVYTAVGKVDEALRSYAAARAVLPTAHPEPAWVCDERVRVLILTGDAERTVASRMRKSLEAFETARELIESSITPDQRGVRDLVNRAAVSRRLGVVYRSLGELTAAKECFQESRDIEEQLLGNSPTHVGFAAGLAESLLECGAMHVTDQALVDAERDSERAANIFEQLVAESPEDSIFQCELGRAWDAIASVKLQLGAIDDAQQACERAAPHHESALAAAPAVVRFREAARVHESVQRRVRSATDSTTKFPSPKPPISNGP